MGTTKRLTQVLTLLALTCCCASAFGADVISAKGALSAAEQLAALNKVREYARSYTASLPNYTCIQLTRQTMTTPFGIASFVLPGRPLRTDLIEEQISFVNGREIRAVTKINDRRPSPAEQEQFVPLSQGEFGNLLDTIFDPQTDADIRWTREETLDGRRVNVFVFRIPQLSGYALVGPKGRVKVPFMGVVYADRHTGAVVRIEALCVGIPANSEYRGLDLMLDYKATKITGLEHLLPSGFLMRYETTQNGVTIAAQYRSCRRFSTDSTITFEGEDGLTNPRR